MLAEKFHALSVEQVETLLRTSAQGLAEEEVPKRRKIYGKNVLNDEKTPIFRILIRQFNSPLIFILIAASLVTIYLQEVTDFFVIVGVIFINSLIGFWQEVRAETTLAALRKLTETKNRVLRAGKIKLIPSSDLVPGDCVLLHQGEVVTADVRIIESASLITDESTITGESVPVVKDHKAVVEEAAFPFDWSNMLLSGSSVVRGTGKGIVVRTGGCTYLASIGEKVKEKPPETPLHQALAHFSRRYVTILLGVLSVVFLVGIFQQRSGFDLFYILLAALVSAVPEGLPIVVTLCMVFGAVLLRHKQTLVRDLPSVETLGATTVIASDKTGTITEGKLLVGDTYTENLAMLKRIAALCNDAQEGLGDPLDVALIEWVEKAEEIRSFYPKKWEYPFDSSRMLMATAHEVNGEKILYVKGAYEALKASVRSQTLEKIDNAYQEFLKKGYRVLAFGEGLFTSEDPSAWELKVVGLIGFIDPPKKGVIHAVAAAKRAGVHVIMITGDHPLTAQAIAHEVGIWNKQSRVLTGKEIEKMDDEELLKELLHTTVLARILPEHKYRVVKVLQSKGEIVAVTGDGVNDIAALKAANIGISMGDGAEAAKSVSQMVLVDNNFSVIVDAIKNARVISANIRKVIYYLVSTSMQELFFLCFSVFSGMRIPLSAIQILWINLVTDGVMDKTFPFIKEEEEVMKLPPKLASEAFFDIVQLKNIMFFGITQGLFCFGLYVYLFPLYSFETVSSIIFTSIVVSQWANALQAQKETEPFFYNLKKSFSINPIVFCALPIGLSLQFAALYLFPSLLQSVPLTSEQWVFPALSFGFAFVVIEVRKLLSNFFKSYGYIQ